MVPFPALSPLSAWQDLKLPLYSLFLLLLLTLQVKDSRRSKTKIGRDVII